METIASAWRRISAWYAANTPVETFALASGATEDELTHFETEIGLVLPKDLRASFALHNGTLNGAFLLHHGELLSLKQILHLRGQYLQWQTGEGWGLGPDYQADEVQGPIEPVWWHPLRLPLTDNSGDAVMADFTPAQGGQIGQIIEFDHEVGPRRVLSNGSINWQMA